MMTNFKVNFENGVPVSTEIVDIRLFTDIKQFKQINNCICIEWYIIECDNENYAMEVAEKVVKEIWAIFFEK